MTQEDVQVGGEVEGLAGPEQGGEFVSSAGAAPGPFRRLRARPQKLYRIGEVVEYSGVSRQTIHNYTTMGLLVETRCTAGGHRLYDESVFDRLDQIEEFKKQRMSMRLIREHFAQVAGPERQVGV